MTVTRLARSYRLRVYEAGSTSTVDFDLDTELGSVPVVGGDDPQPLEGRTEGRPWSVRVIDVAEVLTGELADGSGRLSIVNRLVEFQKDDGAGYTTLDTGRIADVIEAEPGSYDIRIADERSIERGTTIFTTTSTSQFLPAGVVSAFNAFPSAGTFDAFVSAVSGDDVLIEMSDQIISADVLKLLVDDRKADSKPGASSGGVGNFNHLRASVNGTDREVVSFASSIDQVDILTGFTGKEPDSINFVWITWPSHGLAVDDDVTFRLYFKDIEPSETNPLHIALEDPIQTLKDVYDLQYGGDVAVRYDSNVFSAWDASTNPQGLLGHPLIPDMEWRITAPKNLAEWSEALYKALKLVPFRNAAGELAPAFIRLPFDVDPSALPVIDADVASKVPTWNHGMGQVVTSIRGTFDTYRQLSRGEIEKDREWAADLIVATRQESRPFTHDRIDEIGTHAHEIHFDGLHGVGSVESHLLGLSRDIFDRFGDGAVDGDIEGLSAVDVAAGEWVVLSGLPTPNPATGSRGGDRVVQILTREVPAVGRNYRYLDGGPSLAALTTPSVAIAQNSGRSKHDVDVTISGLTSGDRYRLAIKVGTGRWIVTAEGSANETITLRNYPAGTQIQAQVLATREGRIRSPWSSASSVTTASLSAPTSPSATVSGRTIAFTWTNVETAYPVMPTLGGVDYLDTPLPAGSTRFVFTELAASTAFTPGVRAVDPYGGMSSIASAGATTGTAETLSAPRELVVLQGAGSSDTTVYPRKILHGTGLEVGVKRPDLHSEIVLQIDTVDTFTAPLTYRMGAQERFRLKLPLDGTMRYVRARAEKTGQTPSSWTSIVSAKPVPFAQIAGVADGFAGGYADLALDTDNDIILEVGTSDPDTDGFYYVLNKTGFVEPTTSSSFIARASMPYSQDQAVVLATSEIGYLWGKFWSETKGWGQEVKKRVSGGSVTLTRTPQLSPYYVGSDTFGVQLLDPDLTALNLYSSERVGEGAFSTYALKANPPVHTFSYTEAVALKKDHYSYVDMRLQYFIDGQAFYLHATSAGMDYGDEPDITSAKGVSDEDWNISAEVLGDSDTKSIKIKALTGATEPTEAQVRAETAKNGTLFDSGDIGTLISTLSPGVTTHIAVFPYSATGGGGTEGDLVRFKITRPNPEPLLSAVTASVHDNGGSDDDDYSVSWTPNEAVDNSLHDVKIRGGKTGDVSILATATETSPKTSTSKVAIDVNGGDGVSEDHWVEVSLIEQSSGDVLQFIRIDEILSTT